MTLSGLVLTVFAYLVLILNLILLFILPPVPIKPWQIGDVGFFTADTLNEKIAGILFFFTILLTLGLLIFRLIGYSKTIRQGWIKILVILLSFLLLIAILIAGVSLAAELARSLFSP